MVSARHIKVGNTIKPNDPTFRVTNLDPLLAYLHVPEKEFRRLAAGQTVDVVVDALGGQHFEAKIARISPTVDPQTGTFRAEVEVPEDPEVGAAGPGHAAAVHQGGVVEGIREHRVARADDERRQPPHRGAALQGERIVDAEVARRAPEQHAGHGARGLAAPGQDAHQVQAQGAELVRHVQARAFAERAHRHHGGDADRAGAIDERGVFVHQLQVYGLLMYYLVEHRGLRAPVVKSVNETSMAERLGARYGIDVHETPVGFKYVGPKMIETGAMYGGEESGGYGFGMHLPERDGIYSDLLLLDLFLRERAAGRWPASRAIALISTVPL